ncbi:MAG: hypothetical protein ACR2N3_15885 [Pyrinomonadaceae bacterium]
MRSKILQAFKNFSWKQWTILILFFIVVGFTGFYIYRTVERASYWRSHQDQPLANWMSVGYIAHSYHVPPPVLYEAIKLKPEPHDRRPLAQIAKTQNRPVEEIKTELEAALNKFRAENPPPETGGRP